MYTWSHMSLAVIVIKHSSRDGPVIVGQSGSDRELVYVGIIVSWSCLVAGSDKVGRGRRDVY